MAIRGDIEAMGASPADIMEWLTSGDVLRVIEREGVDVTEWIAGVAALKTKVV